MASTILDYKSVAAPSLKSGAGESLLKAAGSDIANAGKLFQDEMARRAEAEFNAEKQAEAVRQFEANLGLNKDKLAIDKDKALQDSLFNEARLKQYEIENTTRQAQANTQALQYRLAKEEFDRKQAFLEMFFGKNPTASTATSPSIAGVTDAIPNPDGTVAGTLIPPGTTGVPSNNGIMAPVQSTPISSEYIFGNQLNDPRANLYGKGGMAGLSSQEVNTFNSGVFTPLVNQGQAFINQNFSDLTDPQQLKQALGYVDRITQNPVFQQNPQLGLDLQTHLKKYLNDQIAGDKAEQDIFRQAETDRIASETAARKQADYNTDKAEKAAEKQAKYSGYKTDFESKLKSGQYGSNVEVGTANQAYDALDPLLNSQNILPKDKYYFYQKLADYVKVDADSFIPGDVGDIRITMPNEYGNDEEYDIGNLSLPQKLELINKYLPSGALQRAIEDTQKRAQEVKDAQDQVDKLNTKLNK